MVYRFATPVRAHDNRERMEKLNHLLRVGAVCADAGNAEFIEARHGRTRRSHRTKWREHLV